MSVPLLLGAALAVLCVVFVAVPFLHAGEPGGEAPIAGADAAEERRLALLEERDRALGALKELEFDHRTGKIAEDDYRAQVGVLRRSAADALRALDAANAPEALYGRSGDRPPPEEPPVSVPQPRLLEQPSIPEPYPAPSEPPEPAIIPEPSPVPSDPPAPVTIPEPGPAPSPPSPE